jgi:hypothetical protein
VGTIKLSYTKVKERGDQISKVFERGQGESAGGPGNVSTQLRDPAKLRLGLGSGGFQDDI